MHGTFRVGDMLYLTQVPVDSLKPGDVVVFRQPDQPGIGAVNVDEDESDEGVTLFYSDALDHTHEVVHRIVKGHQQGWITRGDNNPHNDEGFVNETNYIGLVNQIERRGRKRSIPGGWRGLSNARFGRFNRRVLRFLLGRSRWLYQLIRASGVVPRCWRPVITKAQFNTPEGPLVKFFHSGKSIGQWRPQSDHWVCKKPYDLIIRANERK